MNQQKAGVEPATSSPHAAPQRRGQLYAAAVKHLRAMLVSGQIAPGAALREKQLCLELGISRTPLREAIRTLASEGLVKISPNRSAVASEIDYAEIENLYRTIGHLEALGAQLTCETASEDDLREIHILHHQMLVYYHQRDLRNYIALNRSIHRAIMTLSRNAVLLELWEILVPRVERARSVANLDPNRWDAAVLEHEDILKALSARDSAALTPLMTRHYFNGLAALRAADAHRR